MPHLDHLPALLAHLAGTAVGAFVFAVVIDIVLGVALAVKAKTFDVHKLPSFLESQFGTKSALALLGLVAAAYFSGGDIKQATLAALAAGGGALTAAVAADILGKIKELVAGFRPATPAVAKKAA